MFHFSDARWLVFSFASWLPLVSLNSWCLRKSFHRGEMDLRSPLYYTIPLHRINVLSLNSVTTMGDREVSNDGLWSFHLSIYGAIAHFSHFWNILISKKTMTIRDGLSKVLWSLGTPLHQSISVSLKHVSDKQWRWTNMLENIPSIKCFLLITKVCF